MFERKDITVVKKWLRYSEFAELIESEKFEQMNLSAFKCIDKLPVIQVSENWISINNSYIPRKLIFDFVCVDFDRVLLQGYHEIRAITLNGFEFIVIKVKRDQVRSFLSYMKSAVNEISGSIHNEYIVRSTSYGSIFRNACQKYLATKEDFLGFINLSRKDRDAFLSHDLVAEITAFIYMSYIEHSLTFYSKYFWRLDKQNMRLVGNTGDCEINFNVDLNSEDYVTARIRLKGMEKNLTVLKRAMVDFPNDEKVNKVGIVLSNAVINMLK